MGGHYCLSGFNGLCEPYVAAYHAVIAYVHVAAKYSCACVYHYVVAYVRVALVALYKLAVLPYLKAARAKRYALI